ncbi:unnamed protein product, partial [Discosporangium mesarthrocarpum]
MANIEEDPSGDQPSGLSAMLSSPVSGRMVGSTPVDRSHRGSPAVVVRRTPSRPISIIRSTSVPGQLHNQH